MVAIAGALIPKMFAANKDNNVIRLTVTSTTGDTVAANAVTAARA